MNLPETFVRRPVLTVLAALSVVLFGVLAYLKLAVNDLPVVDYPVIQVSANYPGASPQTMAASVATPLEKQFLQIPGVEVMTSSSNQGTTNITIQFRLDKTLAEAASDVQAAIQAAAGALPADLPNPPTLRKNNPNDSPIMLLSLRSEVLGQGQLYQLGSTNVAQQLAIVPGVSQVGVYGTKPAVRIQVDSRRLASLGLTLSDVQAAVKRSTSDSAAGLVEGASLAFSVEPNGQLETASEYENLIIVSRTLENGSTSIVRLRDVATVLDAVQDIRQTRRFWMAGEKEASSSAVVMPVFRQLGSNTVEVARQVKDKLPELRASLPASVQLGIFQDRSAMIVENIHEVEFTLVLAFALVVVVIFVFLGRATDTIIPAVALPLSLLITFVVMWGLDYTLNNLTLMGLTLAIGFLVDDAIVFLENVVRRMEHGEGVIDATLNGAKEISFTIVSMTISLAVVFLPLVLMPGMVGRVFREFAVTIIVAILASGLVSLTITPLMCSRMLSGRGKGHRKTLMERGFDLIEKPVLRLYGASLWFFIRHKWVSALLWLASLGMTIWLLQQVPKSFLPTGDSGFLRGTFQAAQGTSPEQMKEYQLAIEKILQEDGSFESVFTITNGGPNSIGSQGTIITTLKPRGERDEISVVATRMTQKITAIPGVRAFMRPQPVLQIATGATNQNQGQYAYSLSGVNPDEVYEAGSNLLARLRGYEGFLTVSSDYFPNNPTMVIDIDRDAASRLGVSSTTIESVLRAGLSLNYTYLIRKPDDQYQVIVEIPPGERRSPSDLDGIYVKTDDGQRVIPIKGLIKQTYTTLPQTVNHVNQFTSMTIFFNLRQGANIGEALAFVESSANEVVPGGVIRTLQGEAQTFRDTISSLGILMALAVFVMYVILGILYESYLHPLTVLSSLPVALVGGVGGLYLLGLEASLYAYVGMFMLMGIIKKNGIMIVDFARQRVDAGMKAEDAIHEASMDRFRPIMMTTLAAAAGALPIALGYGADGQSRMPLGVVIVAGLAVAQFITLFITPAIYLYFELFQEKVLDRTSFFRHARHLEGSVRTLEPGANVPSPSSRIGEPVLVGAGVGEVTVAPHHSDNGRNGSAH